MGHTLKTIASPEGWDVVYRDHPELHIRSRTRRHIERAEEILADGQAPSPKEQLFLFKAMHAAGFGVAQSSKMRKAWMRSAERWARLYKRLVDELVSLNVGLVYNMHRRTRLPGVDGDDLTSEGFWLLFRAVQRFDPWRGFRFSTYACTSIIRGYHALSRRRQRQNEAARHAFDEKIQTEEQQRVTSDAEKMILAERVSDALNDEKTGLSAMERFVVHRRLLAASSLAPATLESVGEAVDLSKEGVRQIQISALNKIRGAVRARSLADAKARHARRTPTEEFDALDDALARFGNGRPAQAVA